MTFLTEPEPPRLVPLAVAEGVTRIVAPNPGPMTYHGTNTYLINGPAGLTVLDPGPERPNHVQAILEAAGGKVSLILISHTHIDHVGAVSSLKRATGAPVAGFAVSALEGFQPDLKLAEGGEIAGLTALHTPGHASDHLCFAMRSADGRNILFSGDHVMSWSSSVVSPPGGDMRAYFASLTRLLERQDELYLPGHGPPLVEPRSFVGWLLGQRKARERAVRHALGPTAVSLPTLLAAVYPELRPELLRAAERTLLAHLVKLEQDGQARREGDGWRRA